MKHMKLNNTDFIRLSEAPELWHGTPHNMDKFMYSNLNTIINQIKTTYKDTIPGLEDLFV